MSAAGGEGSPGSVIAEGFIEGQGPRADSVPALGGGAQGSSFLGPKVAA